MALELEQRGARIGQFCGGSFRLDSMPFEIIDQTRLGPEQFHLLLGANINNLSTSEQTLSESSSGHLQEEEKHTYI